MLTRIDDDTTTEDLSNCKRVPFTPLLDLKSRSDSSEFEEALYDNEGGQDRQSSSIPAFMLFNYRKKRCCAMFHNTEWKKLSRRSILVTFFLFFGGLVREKLTFFLGIL